MRAHMGVVIWNWLDLARPVPQLHGAQLPGAQLPGAACKNQPDRRPMSPGPQFVAEKRNIVMTASTHSPAKAAFSAAGGELTPLMVEDMRSVCRDAWQQGLLSGCNGNASLRLPAPHGGTVCLTRSGAAKGRLTAEDCCLVSLADGATLHGGPASTESGMHLAVYRALPGCAAILHTHPRRLLALSLRLGENMENFLNLPLFEAGVWRARLGFAPALPPGTTELAQAVGQAARTSPAVWMAGHGLCSTGASLAEALCLTEELEHLAAIQLLSMS